MCKDRRAMEVKRQHKLEKLAKMFVCERRFVESFVIRNIVTPYLEKFNRTWANMKAIDKFKSILLSNRQSLLQINE